MGLTNTPSDAKKKCDWNPCYTICPTCGSHWAVSRPACPDCDSLAGRGCSDLPDHIRPKIVESQELPGVVDLRHVCLLCRRVQDAAYDGKASGELHDDTCSLPAR